MGRVLPSAFITIQQPWPNGQSRVAITMALAAKWNISEHSSISLSTLHTWTQTQCISIMSSINNKRNTFGLYLIKVKIKAKKKSEKYSETSAHEKRCEGNNILARRLIVKMDNKAASAREKERDIQTACMANGPPLVFHHLQAHTFHNSHNNILLFLHAHKNITEALAHINIKSNDIMQKENESNDSYTALRCCCSMSLLHIVHFGGSLAVRYWRVAHTK